MKPLLAFSLVLSITPVLTSAKNMDELLSTYSAATWKSPHAGAFLYRHSSPSKMEKGAKYPLLVFFHGAGGRGNDNKGQLVDAGGIGAFEKAGLRTKRSSHVFAGQVPKGERWVDVHWALLGHRMPKVSDSMRMAFEAAMGLVRPAPGDVAGLKAKREAYDEARMAFEALDAYVADEKNQVDPNRIYVMGLSMGGYGTWDAIQRRPGFFAAAVPICGGGDLNFGKRLKDLLKASAAAGTTTPSEP